MFRSENRRLDYPGLKFSYGDGSDDDGTSLAAELPSCVYAAARGRLQLPLAAYVHQHTRQLHTGEAASTSSADLIIIISYGDGSDDDGTSCRPS